MNDEDLRNGTATPEAFGAAVVNSDVVNFLQAMVEEARMGRYASVAVVAIIPPGAVHIATVGNVNAEMVVGLEHLKNKVIEGFFSPPPVPQKPSRSGLVMPERFGR